MTNQRAIKVINVFLGTEDLCSCSEGRLHVSCNDCRREAARMAIEALKEHKTGKWILTATGDDGYCSVCNCDMPIFFEDYEYISRETKFCPNCGARMVCAVKEIK